MRRYVFPVIFLFLLLLAEGVRRLPRTQETALQNVTSGQITKSINDWRVKRGKPPYVETAKLCTIAEERAEQIQDDFSHDQFLANADKYYDILGYYRIYENIAERFYSADELLQAWLDSASHAATLKKDLTYSCVRCKYGRCAHIFGEQMP